MSVSLQGADVTVQVFSQGALYEIGSAMAFFTVKNYTDEFLAALEKGIKSSKSVATADDETIGATVEGMIAGEMFSGH